MAHQIIFLFLGEATVLQTFEVTIVRGKQRPKVMVGGSRCTKGKIISKPGEVAFDYIPKVVLLIFTLMQVTCLNVFLGLQPHRQLISAQLRILLT